MKKLILLLIFPLLFNCQGDSENNMVINKIIESQNYDSEIANLIWYSIITISLFVVIGYIRIKKKK
tara:strand:- start:4213 stop:4410 length:198 start_codon:yes stop_codon:yes gene_type:complete